MLRSKPTPRMMPKGSSSRFQCGSGSRGTPLLSLSQRLHRPLGQQPPRATGGPDVEEPVQGERRETQIEQQDPEQAEGDADLVSRAAKLAADVVVNPIFYLFAGLLAIKLAASTGEQSLTIFVFAALPVTLLTALSKSSVGRRVQENLEAQLPQLEEDADRVRAAWQEAKASSPWFGPNRPQLPRALGGGAQHLNGEYAGDYGFDPLGLGAEPEAFDRHREAELLHARWAMLAAVGCIIPEALAMAGIPLDEPVWYRVGAAKLRDDITLNYAGIEGFRIAGKQGIFLIMACQLVLMGGPEYARYVGIKSLEPVGVFLPGDKNYPGGPPFDPAGFAQDPPGFLEQQTKEIRNGRLAMVAMVGYAAQGAVTGTGPLQNLLDFIADPAHQNVLQYLNQQ